MNAFDQYLIAVAGRISETYVMRGHDKHVNINVNERLLLNENMRSVVGA